MKSGDLPGRYGLDIWTATGPAVQEPFGGRKSHSKREPTTRAENLSKK
jgi:hypothetical protein